MHRSTRQDLVGSFLLHADNASSVPRIANAIDAMFENSTAETKTESEQAFGLSFLAFLGNVKLFLLAICGAVTFTILLVSANTMAMSVRERIREVGIMKTLGFPNGSILGIILGEAAMISVIGGAVGILLGRASPPWSGRPRPAFLSSRRWPSLRPSPCSAWRSRALLGW